MLEPESAPETGPFMSFSVSDFRLPKNETWNHEEEKAFVEQLKHRKQEKPPTQQRDTPEPPRLPIQRDRTEYPEWIDDLPPWRNPDQKGNRYLYVHEQHPARIRGHH